MQPTSWPVGAGEMGETGTPGGWPKTWASLRVVRIRPARSLAESAFAAEKVGRAGSRSEVSDDSPPGFFPCAGDVDVEDLFVACER